MQKTYEHPPWSYDMKIDRTYLSLHYFRPLQLLSTKEVLTPSSSTLVLYTHLHCTSFLLEGKGTNSQVSLSCNDLNSYCMDVCHIGSSDASWYFLGLYPTTMKHFLAIFNSHAETSLWNWDPVFLGSNGLPARFQVASIVFLAHFCRMGKSWYEFMS